MAIEIERKFLVSGEFRQDSPESYRIMQGYICSDPDRTVRVRVRGDKGFLTIKGRGSEGGLSRYEWEKEIPVSEAFELMALCGSGVIDKTRYLVPFGKHTYEVDVFHGANEGLVRSEEHTSELQSR